MFVQSRSHPFLKGTMIAVAAVLAAAALGGCVAEPTSAGPRYHVAGDADTVSVWGAGDEATALANAEQHCEAYGKTARFVRMKANHLSRVTTVKSASFECVTAEPSG